MRKITNSDSWGIKKAPSKIKPQPVKDGGGHPLVLSDKTKQIWKELLELPKYSPWEGWAKLANLFVTSVHEDLTRHGIDKKRIGVTTPPRVVVTRLTSPTHYGRYDAKAEDGVLLKHKLEINGESDRKVSRGKTLLHEVTHWVDAVSGYIPFSEEERSQANEHNKGRVHNMRFFGRMKTIGDQLGYEFKMLDWEIQK